MEKRFTNYQLMSLTRVISLLAYASNDAAQSIWWEQRESTDSAIKDLANAKEWTEKALSVINELYDELNNRQDDKDNH